jgi:hypothetical protein
MKRRTLAMHKQAAKVLRAAPAFSTIKRGKLPKPLDRVGGPSVQMTNLIEVGDGYSVWFMWKDGETLVQSAFYGYLFHQIGQNNLYPLCHFHWHPSHKPIHFTSPCDSDLNYTNRGLPGAKELNLTSPTVPYDPRKDIDRLKLIEVFCATCGIAFGQHDLL